jgi:hypothetical protein
MHVLFDIQTSDPTEEDKIYHPVTSGLFAQDTKCSK